MYFKICIVREFIRFNRALNLARRLEMKTIYKYYMKLYDQRSKGIFKMSLFNFIKNSEIDS